jgi:hypothetical protein
MLIWIALAVGFAVVVAQAARYRHERTLTRWNGLLSREMRTAVKALEMEMQVDAAMADDSLRDALHARERQEHFEAIRLLELSCNAIEDATPDRLKRLRAMGVLIRMAVALSPVRPLRMRDYHLRELIAVVGAASALHHVLVTALERFLLRVQVLGVGFRLALRVMVVARNRATDGPAAPRPWVDYERALADWKTLDREHLETFRALARSLDAEPAAERAALRL